MIDRPSVDAWVQAYEDAWRTPGTDLVAELIARQSLGEPDSVADARPVPAED